MGKFACERYDFPESFGTGLPLKVSVPSTVLSLLYTPLLACSFVLLLQIQLEGRRVKFVLASPVLTVGGDYHPGERGWIYREPPKLPRKKSLVWP